MKYWLAPHLMLGVILFAASWAGAAPPSPAMNGQSLVQLRGETDAAFAARVLRLGDDDVHVLATTWNGARTLFVDWGRGWDTESPERPLIALQQTGPATFRRLLVTVGETEGGAPDIEAIGFANADNDPAKELIVVLAWNQVHYDACGPIFEVRIIDDADPARANLRELPISKHFGDGCVEKPGRYRFTTIDAVKRELKRLGY